MAFKEFNDVDSNGLEDSSEHEIDNEFDLSGSDEIAVQLEREELGDSPEEPEQQTEGPPDTLEAEDVPEDLENDDNLGPEDQGCCLEEEPFPDSLEDDSELGQTEPELEPDRTPEPEIDPEVDPEEQDYPDGRNCQDELDLQTVGLNDYDEEKHLTSDDSTRDDECVLGDALNSESTEKCEIEPNSKFEITPDIKMALTTERDTAYFWSGLGPAGKDIAKEIAVDSGGTTLENQLEKNKIDMPEWSFSDENSKQAWRDASACYAENCSGEVHVLAGKIREGSVFESTEYDKLVANENVSSISLVEPESGKKQIIFDRDDPNQNAVKVAYEENGQRYVRFERKVEWTDEIDRY